ncbi:MAG: hypothetical protein KA715_11385 [Xanthomonadaceae bacterium]|nr:hypothetical protein [Xanthomonadaceae bacterium]
MKRNELKMWAARFVTIGLMTLVAACGQTQPPINNGACPGPGCPNGPGGLGQGQVACMPIQPGAPMPFSATGIWMNSINLQFGRLPNGQTIGQVAMGGAVMGGMQYTGGSNATGSTISILLQNTNANGFPTGGYYQPNTTINNGAAKSLTGFIQISQYELQLAGLLNQNFMGPGSFNQFPNQGFNNGFNGNGVVPGVGMGQACVSSVGATGALNNAYAKFYGGASDYVYVYINNGQSYIRFKI